MLKHTNGLASPTPSLLTYAINDIEIDLLPSGDLLVGDHHLSQQQAFALSVALRLPLMTPIIRQQEKHRQQAQALESD